MADTKIKKTRKVKGVEAKKTSNNEIDREHDKTITLMTGVLIVLVAAAAILFACSYYLNF